MKRSYRHAHRGLPEAIAITSVATAVAAAALFTACTGQKNPSGSSSTQDSAILSSTSSSESSEVPSTSSASSASASSAVSSEVSSASSAASSSASSSAAGYTVYTNERFGFSVPVPASLKALSGEGSGKTFASSDNTVILSATGSNNAQNLSPADYFDQYFYQRQAGITSKEKSGNALVLTWKVDGKIGYAKCVVGTGSINTVRFQFPESQKSQYETVAQYIVANFKTPDVDSTH